MISTTNIVKLESIERGILVKLERRNRVYEVPILRLRLCLTDPVIGVVGSWDQKTFLDKWESLGLSVFPKNLEWRNF